MVLWKHANTMKTSTILELFNQVQYTVYNLTKFILNKKGKKKNCWLPWYLLRYHAVFILWRWSLSGPLVLRQLWWSLRLCREEFHSEQYICTIQTSPLCMWLEGGNSCPKHRAILWRINMHWILTKRNPLMLINTYYISDMITYTVCIWIYVIFFDLHNIFIT